MLFGTGLLITCFFLGIAFVALVEEKKWHALDRYKMTIAMVIMFGPSVIGPLVAEYPSLLLPPTVATFNDDQLVLHKWGLWTPPWRWSSQEVVNIPVRMGSCFKVDSYNNGYTYQDLSQIRIRGNNGNDILVKFHATACFENPEVPYKDHAKRRQSWNPFREGNPIGKATQLAFADLIGFHRTHAEELKVAAEDYCWPSIEGGKEFPCGSLAKDKIEPFVQGLVEPLGFRVHVSAKARPAP